MTGYRDGASRVLDVAIRLLPDQRAEWGEAMRAELASLTGGRQRHQFAWGCVVACLSRGPVLWLTRYLALVAVGVGAATFAGVPTPVRVELIVLAVFGPIAVTARGRLAATGSGRVARRVCLGLVATAVVLEAGFLSSVVPVGNVALVVVAVAIVVAVLALYCWLLFEVTASVSHVDSRGLVAIVGLGLGAGVVWSALMPFETNLAVTGPAATAAYYVLLALAIVGAPAGAALVATRRLDGIRSPGTVNPIMVTAATGAVAGVTSLAGGAAVMWALPWLPDSALLDTGPSYRPPDMVEHVIPSYVGVLIAAPAVAALAGWLIDRTRRRRLAGMSLLGLALLTWPLLSQVDSDSTAFAGVGTTNVVFSPAGGTLLTANADYTWILWNIIDPAHPTRLATFNDQVLYSPDGSLLASRNVLWSLRDPGHPARLTLFRAGEPVAFSADGQILATHNASDMMLWNVTDPIHPVQLARFAAADQALFSPDRRSLFILDDDASVATVWSLADLAHPAQEATIPDAGGWTLSPDGRTLVLAQWQSPVRAWDVSDPAHPWLIGALPTDSGDKVAISPDSRTFTSARSDGTIRLWNARDLSPLATLPPPSEPTPRQIGASDTLTTVAFSADGHTLASVTGNTTESRWAITDPTHPVRLSTVTRETNGAGVVRFSPDLSTVAGAAIDGSSNSITLWRVA